MPIYEIGEHEILSEEATMIKEDGDTETGSLYLTDKRLLFEKKGKRGFIRATPAQIIVDIRLYDVSNVTSAVPRIKAMTKKSLIVEYQDEDQVRKIRFRTDDPREWEDKMRKWVSDAKRLEEERITRIKDEDHRKEIEMARAKAGVTNVGVAYYGDKKNAKGKQNKNSGFGQGNIIDAETSDTTDIRKAEGGSVAEYKENSCPNCGSKLDSGMKFCPNCGEKI